MLEIRQSENAAVTLFLQAVNTSLLILLSVILMLDKSEYVSILTLYSIAHVCGFSLPSNTIAFIHITISGETLSDFCLH